MCSIQSLVLKYFHETILLFLKSIFHELNSLSIANDDEYTPECVYLIFSLSRIVCTYPSSPYVPCNALKTISGFSFLNSFIRPLDGSNNFTLYLFLIDL